MTEREAHLHTLGPAFMAAMEHRANGRVDQALDGFASVLRAEPRLAEPRMEIARIHLETGRLEEAEIEAREALRILLSGGQWTDDLPENVVQALGWALLAEILKEKAASDEVVFGDPEQFKTLIGESRAAFAKAAELDPTDNSSWANALELAEERRDREEMTGDIADEAGLGPPIDE
jgi:tetratricopeptide (TPR) repeat protein